MTPEILGIPEPKKPTIASTSVFDDEEPSRARPISGRRAELRSTSSFPMVTDVCDVGAVLALRSQSCSGLPGSRYVDQRTAGTQRTVELSAWHVTRVYDDTLHLLGYAAF